MISFVSFAQLKSGGSISSISRAKVLLTADELVHRRLREGMLVVAKTFSVGHDALGVAGMGMTRWRMASDDVFVLGGQRPTPRVQLCSAPHRVRVFDFCVFHPQHDGYSWEDECRTWR